ncbi:MAG: carboxy terminal-processing peptidase [Akkermansiaceae bacterium]|nr:carboxy terminal-processing peptidase [Akkermansiaceae bacterium]MCF7731101.1 carboxy terminal-processing peptidase [Akkermansiaceae bacterium]
MVAASCSACAQQADFNEVGKQMAITLQNNHFQRIPFDKELSQRILFGFLRDLDYQRLYFTQQDVDQFSGKFGENLNAMLLEKKSMGPAEEIYGVFVKRVEARVALTEKLLKENHFDFTTDQYVARSRKDAAWPKDEAEADSLWSLQIREAVLSEVLRRDLLAKLAKEQGKPEPAKNDRDPKEKIGLRYKRFLASVQDVDAEDIANYFLSAVAKTYDPHTDYMSAREMSRFKDGMKNELVGIGALLQGEEDGATKIMGIVVGGPADRDGQLKLNDRVVAVDSLNTGNPEDMVDIMFMKIDKVVDLIRGKTGTTVGLKVEPAGAPPGEAKIYEIQREKVELKDEQASGQIVEVKGKNGAPSRRLGIIILPSFYADFDEGKVRCSVDVERILGRLVEEKIDGLILDLRNNGGGSLDEVCRMTGFFIDRGPVVQVKDNRGRVKVKESENRRPIYEGPMVVMTDKTSASASEILAGALQDANRAVIVGESSTFGKGTVQQPMNIEEMMPFFAPRARAGFLKLTIQKFYRPSGSSTQKDGVVPQLVLPSALDGLEIGESYLDNVMPHDRISPAPGFRPQDVSDLFLPKLKELSQERVNASKDFAYIIEDVMRTRKRVAENKVALNMELRAKELAEVDARRVARNKERRERYAGMSEEDKKRFRFYKLSLDDLKKGADVHEYDPAAEDGDYMRRAKDETEELDDSPKWPSGMDPVKRESLMVLRDLVDFTDNAKMAGVLRKTASEY